VSDVPDGIEFRISTYSGGGGCVEVAAVPDGTVVVRHSRFPHLGELPFSRHEWTAFIRGVKDGEFDLPEPG
jgi:hypothetical protein